MNVIRLKFPYGIMLNDEVLLDVFIPGLWLKMATAVWVVTEPIMQLFGWLTAGYGFCGPPFLQELKVENWVLASFRYDIVVLYYSWNVFEYNYAYIQY